jgi:hypothetical protein
LFLYPVDAEEVPDYLNIIQHPMDFTTMRRKLDDYQYLAIEDFEV